MSWCQSWSTGFKFQVVHDIGTACNGGTREVVSERVRYVTCACNCGPIVVGVVRVGVVRVGVV